jgi:two-component system, chemotaxis family, sensor kinase CheA
MASKDQEYKEIFTAEASENHEELNRLLTQLEKTPSDKAAIDSIFRITHTLKGNALGMGFQEIAEMAHTLEDLFGEIRSHKLTLNDEIFTSLFKAVDVLGELVNALMKPGAPVKYRGVKTKLEVLMREAQKAEGAEDDATEPTEVSHVGTPKKEVSQSPKPASKSKKAVAEVISEEVEVPEVETVLEVENKITFSDLVQVPVRKLDNLLNLVGELIIERDRLISQNTTQRSNEYSRLNRISSDLQYSVMDVRLVQVGFLFNKFHRVVRDAANVEGKKVRLQLEGVDTEIDRNILQIISDSLIHLIRNCVGHGIETPENRLKSDKKEEGTVILKASSESDGVIIEIKDDGKGIDIAKVREKVIKNSLVIPEMARQMSDKDILQYIFEPGFSTADTVTSISGRGVGMDVVKKALDSVGGTIDVATEAGKGTTIKLMLPSSMAVKGTLLFQLEETDFAVPLSYTEAVVSVQRNQIHKVANGLVTDFQGKSISVVFLRDLFYADRAEGEGSVLHRSFHLIPPDRKLDVVVVNYNGKTIGLVVDKLMQQKEIVEKPLSKPVDSIKFVGGVTILGNGNVCLVINIPTIINFIFSYNFVMSLKNKNASLL